MIENLGVVVIGRNEGQRLLRCLGSIICKNKVYVDSGSTDTSVESATGLGVDCVELDLSRPFTAARARNAGFDRLMAVAPNTSHVLFVDGDCELYEGWIEKALLEMSASPDVAVICGRRRERYPQASIYNLFCDIEWNTPVGFASSCGGDAIYRAEVFKSLNGFDPGFIAGEEPELCFRIRAAGWKVLRMNADMVYHDASMSKFLQWFKRTERSGHAYLLGWAKHGSANQERFYRKDLRGILFWSGLWFVAMLVSISFYSILPIVFLAVVMIAQVFRVFWALSVYKAEYGVKAVLLYSFFLMLGKVPQVIGVIKAYVILKTGKRHGLVEYK